MVIPIVLIGAAKLEQVVAFQHGNVVTNHVVVSIPEAAANVLVVDVERAKNLGLRLAASNSSAPPSPAICGGAPARDQAHQFRRKL